MTGDRHITWENFERDVVRANLPASHPIPGIPRITIHFGPADSELGLRIALPVAKAVPASPFREIQMRAMAASDGPQLCISTHNRGLYRQLFPVLLEIADSVQLDGVDPYDAANSAVEKITEAIRLLAIPSVEWALGLWGELWVLKRLLNARAPEAIRHWHGWQRDRHDFRIDKVELEVKTTVAAPVTHMVHGMGQLEASDGHDLYLLSVAVSRSGQGTSLASLVEQMEGLLPSGTAERKYLRNALDRLGATEDALRAMTECYVLRRPVILIPVDEKVPAIGTTILSSCLTPDALGRVSELSYRVNVEGLGCAPDTELFRNVVPWLVNHD